MANVAAVAGETLLIQIGDGGGPETFAHKCMINTERGFSLDAIASEAEVADCANQTNPAYIRRAVKAVSMTISGAGIYDSASSKYFADWLLSGAAKNIRVNQSQTGANGGYYISCSAILTAFAATGGRGETETATLTIMSAGAITTTANA